MENLSTLRGWVEKIKKENSGEKYNFLAYSSVAIIPIFLNFPTFPDIIRIYPPRENYRKDRCY